MTPPDGPATSTVAVEPPAVARSIAMELVTRYGLSLADQRDSRLGRLAGQYELTLATWTGSRGVLVGFYRPPVDPLAASLDLATRCQAALAWGAERLTTQRAETCAVLIVVLGKVARPDMPPLPKGAVTVGAVALDRDSGEVQELLPVPSGLPRQATCAATFAPLAPPTTRRPSQP